MPPQNPGLVSGTQVREHATPVVGSQFGPSAQTYPEGQPMPEASSHVFGCGQVGIVTVHWPFTHVDMGQAAVPSAHTTHAARSCGQSESLLQLGFAIGWQTPGQSA